MTTSSAVAEMRGLLAPGRRRAYCLAGNAVMTVRSLRTGTRFTYKITEKKAEKITSCGLFGKPVGESAILWFVKILTGPDNGADYEYLGTIFPNGFRVTSKSRVGTDAPSAVAFRWLSENWEDERVEVWHEGHCGRLLTVPESAASGIGPTCAGYGQ